MIMMMPAMSRPEYLNEKQYLFPVYIKVFFQVKFSKIEPCHVPLGTGSSGEPGGQVKT